MRAAQQLGWSRLAKLVAVVSEVTHSRSTGTLVYLRLIGWNGTPTPTNDFWVLRIWALCCRMHTRAKAEL